MTELKIRTFLLSLCRSFYVFMFMHSFKFIPIHANKFPLRKWIHCLRWIELYSLGSNECRNDEIACAFYLSSDFILIVKSNVLRISNVYFRLHVYECVFHRPKYQMAIMRHNAHRVAFFSVHTPIHSSILAKRSWILGPCSPMLRRCCFHRLATVRCSSRHHWNHLYLSILVVFANIVALSLLLFDGGGGCCSQTAPIRVEWI